MGRTTASAMPRRPTQTTRTTSADTLQTAMERVLTVDAALASVAVFASVAFLTIWSVSRRYTDAFKVQLFWLTEMCKRGRCPLVAKADLRDVAELVR